MEDYSRKLSTKCMPCQNVNTIWVAVEKDWGKKENDIMS